MQLRFLTAGAAFLAAACGGLSHPLSNDGADSGNPVGANPGTTILTLNVANTSLTVGDTVSITGSLGGAPLQNTGLFNAVSSDPSVATVGGVVIFARSVGSTTISASYSGYQASPPIDIAVLPTADGVAAFVTDNRVNPPTFVPGAVAVKAGSSVRFSISTGHGVAFDAMTGAPADISPTSTGSTVDRPFPVAGSFTYHCPAHGESGVINVSP
jgi:plastocyanin